MGLELRALQPDNMVQFKEAMQQAFQKGAVDEFGEMQEEILPESHIDRSLALKGAIAYEAFVDEKSVGGAIVVIDEQSQHNHLDFLFVKVGIQNKGVGQAIWHAIEKLHPETKVWETCTPYFEKRNIHFYINRCGFHAVEFYNKNHPDPNDKELYDEGHPENDYFEGMFRFEKVNR